MSRNKPRERRKLPLPAGAKVTFTVYRDSKNRARIIQAKINLPYAESVGVAICSTIDIAKGMMRIGRGKEIALGKAFKTLTKGLANKAKVEPYYGRKFKSPMALEALKDCGLSLLYGSLYVPKLSIDYKPIEEVSTEGNVCSPAPEPSTGQTTAVV